MADEKTDAWQEMDDWCVKKAAELTVFSDRHILAGRDIADPEYRRILGQSQAFARMRSFIHSARRSY